MKHPLFDILISVSYLLLAIRLAQFLEIQDRDSLNFYPVNSNIQLRTATDHNLLTHIPQICSISILRKSLRFKDHRSGKLTHLYIFVLLISNSWDTETNPIRNPLLTTRISPADYVMSVLAGKTEGFVAIHVTSGTTLTARVCHQLCMVFTTNP